MAGAAKQMAFLRRNLQILRLWTAFSCSPRRSHVADAAGARVTEAALTAQRPRAPRWAVAGHRGLHRFTGGVGDSLDTAPTQRVHTVIVRTPLTSSPSPAGHGGFWNRSRLFQFVGATLAHAVQGQIWSTAGYTRWPLAGSSTDGNIPYRSRAGMQR